MNRQITLKKTWVGLILFAVIVPITTLLVWFGAELYDQKVQSALIIENQTNLLSHSHIESEIQRLNTLLINKSDPLSLLIDTINYKDDIREIKLLLKFITEREPSINKIMVFSEELGVIAAIDLSLGIPDSLITTDDLQTLPTQWGIDNIHESSEVVIPMSGKSYIGQTLKYDDYFGFSMAVPIGKTSKAVLIAIIDALPLSAFNFLHVQNHDAANVQHYLLDVNGSLIPIFNNNEDISVKPMTHLDIVNSAILDQNWFIDVTYDGISNQRVYGTFTKVSSLGWILLSEIPVTSITRPVWYSMTNLILISCISLIAFIWLVLVMALKTLQPIKVASVAIEKAATGKFEMITEHSSIHELRDMTLGINKMIKARKSVEGILRKTKYNLIRAQEIAKIGNWKFNIHTKKIEGSAELNKIFGIEGKMVDPIELNKIVHPEDRGFHIKHLRNGLVHGVPWNIEYKIVSKNGSIQWVHSIGEPQVDKRGKVTSIIGIVQNITERKRIVKKLEESEEFLNSTGKMAKVGGWALDLETKKVKWTQSTMMIHEVSEGYIPSLDDAIEFYHPDDRKMVSDCVNSSIESGESYMFEARIKTKKGNERWVKALGVPVHRDGICIRLSGTFQDITEYKRSKEEIHLYSKLIQDSTNEVYMFDLESFKFFEVNMSAQKNIGYTLEELYHLSPADIKPDHDENSFYKLIKPLIDNKTEEVLFYTTHQRKDGSLYPVEVRLQQIIFEKRKVFASIILDITERNKAEEEMSANAERFKRWQESNFIGIFHSNADGKIIEANQTLLSMIGYSKQTLQEGKLNWRNLTPRKFLLQDKTAMEEVLVKGFWTPYEKEFVHSDGHKVPIIIGGSIFKQDPGEFIVFVIDISENVSIKNELSRLYQKSLVASENWKFEHKRYKEILQQSLDGVITINQNQIITYCNKAAIEMLGYNKSELINKSINDFLPHWVGVDHKGYVQNNIDRGISRVTHTNNDFEMTRKDGTKFWCSIAVSKVITSKGTEFTSFIKDVSKRVEDEQQILSFNSELESKIKERTSDLEAYSYSVSHDLRTPLRAISGYSQLLLDEFMETINEEGKEYLREIQDNTNHMAKLIDDILEFSKLSNTDIRKLKVNLNEIVDFVIDRFDAEIKSKGLKFVVYDLGTVYGDQSMIQVVFNNLISNAIKFSSKKNDHAIIEIGVEKKNKLKTYFVKDNGIGFDMKFKKNLFKVFNRLHTVEHYEGTGIGLAIVHRIINKHNGKIWAEGEENVGATFFFNFENNTKTNFYNTL